jgi:hypothetical protein
MQPTQERGGCLTVWLGLTVVAFAVSAFTNLFSSANLAQIIPTMPSWAFTALGVASVVGLVSAVGLWMWKRWGFYSFMAVAIGVAVINAMSGQLIAGAVMAALSVGIMWYFIKGKWAQFA